MLVRGWRGALAAGLMLGAAGGARACDIGADPAITIVAGGAVLEQADVDCALGVTQLLVPEGGAVTLKGEPADPDGGCGTLSSWNESITRGGSLGMDEIFAGKEDELVSFIGNSEPESTFTFDINPNPANVQPASGGRAEFETLALALGAAGVGGAPEEGAALTGSWQIVGGTGVNGRIDVDVSQIEITWHVRAQEVPGEISAGTYGAFAPGHPVGYNPGAPAGTQTLPAGTPLSLTFQTPSFAGTPDYTTNFYAVFAEAALPWTFSGPGGSGDATIGLMVCEEVPNPAAASPPPPPATPPPATVCDPVEMTINLRGTAIHRSSPTGAGGEGHPAVAVIAVQDITAPVAAETLQDGSLGVAKAGSPLENNLVQVALYDNNPYAQAGDYTAEGWYLVERSHWKGSYGGDPPHAQGMHAGVADADASHLALGDDSFAVNTEHVFRWAEAGSQNGSSAEQLLEGDEPVGLKVTFEPFEISEPTGSQWAFGVTPDASHKAYVDDGLKFVYRVSDDLVGKVRPDAVPEPTPDASVAETWSGVMTGDYRTGGAPVPDLDYTDAADDVLAARCAACGGAKTLAGLPTWEVEDELPPSLVLVAHDMKYDRYYYFGHNFLGDANTTAGLNERYLDAFTNDASAHDPDSAPNLHVVPWDAAGDLFDQNDSDEGYANQVTGYTTAFLPVGVNFGAGTYEYPGLWIDEDTRVEFWVRAWDNIDGWRETPWGGGVDDVSFRLEDEPDQTSMDEPGIHLFRNPNRGADGLEALGDAFVEVSARDVNGNETAFKVMVYVADNQLRIYSLEESRRRLSN